MATDNAVSALGKILDVHNQANLVQPWLTNLPLRGIDLNESRDTLRYLLKLIKQKPQFILGPGDANAPHLIRAIISYLELPKVAGEEEVLSSHTLLIQVCIHNCKTCKLFCVKLCNCNIAQTLNGLILDNVYESTWFEFIFLPV